MKPKVAVLTGFGINCDYETAAVFEMAGGISERIHINHLCNNNKDLSDYHILAIPGGFSFGDHLGSGRLMGNRMRFNIRDQLNNFISSGKPIIGICNGFQVLVKTGLLPGKAIPDFKQTASLTLNNSGKYEDRWVTLEFDKNSPCIWTKDITRMEVPVRHGEGKFVMQNNSQLDELQNNHQIVAQYVDPNSEMGATNTPLPYPLCPNGSMRNIAGICDPTGLIFGLMPHPEAHHSTWLHPRWTSEINEHKEGEGMAIFHNAIQYVKDNLQ